MDIIQQHFAEFDQNGAEEFSLLYLKIWNAEKNLKEFVCISRNVEQSRPHYQHFRKPENEAVVSKIGFETGENDPSEIHEIGSSYM